MVEQVSGRPVNTRMAERRAGDPPVLVAAPGMAEQLLGWKPACSSLQTIIETALRWHEKDRELTPTGLTREPVTSC
jgi:UDP-glucose 4-epimerase